MPRNPAAPSAADQKAATNFKIKRDTLETLRIAKLVYGMSPGQVVDSAVALWAEKVEVHEKLKDLSERLQTANT